MSLRPPSTSPSPSPGPHDSNRQERVRQSMGPASRGTPSMVPASPRPGGGSSARPASELLGGAGMYQTPEAEALDQWFENLQNYEATLEDMAAASLDVNFKEELSAIEQWFKVLSEAERTAALYSLLQHSTQVQIRFFITVLQQMARSDPMTALLSPAIGGSMQNQMDAKLASIKSPGLMSGFPASPTARSFNTGGNPNRQSLGPSALTDNFLSPESAANASGQDAAATLAQQRAKLKASNAAHRISAPVLAGGSSGASWGPAAGLGQLAETNNNNSSHNSAQQQQTQELGSPRPKSTEFSGSPRPPAAPSQEITHSSDSWASMVNTPLIPMFANDQARRDKLAMEAAANKLTDWNSGQIAPPGVPKMGDPTVHRRSGRSNDGGSRNTNTNVSNHSTPDLSGGVYGDDGNLIGGGQQAQQYHGQQQYQQQQQRPVGGLGTRNVSNPNDNGSRWSGSRSPGLPNANINNRFGTDDNMNQMNALGMQLNALSMANGGNSAGIGGFNLPGLSSPGGMGGPMSPFNLNMLGAMGLSPEAQLLAAQMAAASQFGQQGWMGQQSAGLNGMGMNLAGMNMMNMNMMNNRRGPGSARSVGGGLRSASSTGTGRTTEGGGTPKGEEDVDPALLNDIPSWLRSLRLHKYTPNFEHMKWQDMVVMDEAALEAKGVAALGARRKLLKTFEIVRKKMDIPGGPPSSAAS